MNAEILKPKKGLTCTNCRSLINLTTLMCVSVSSLLMLCSAGCSNTKSITNASAFPRKIEAAKKSQRYFLMHSGVDIYRISSVIVERSKQHFTVQLNKPASLHTANINNLSAVNEKLIHLFMKDSTSYTLDEPHTILLSKIARIELANK